MKNIFTLALVLATGSLAQAQTQESLLNVLRSDVRTQVSALIEGAMQFSDAEASAFWPIYREFELETAKLGDRRIALIKDYAENFESMTDEKSDAIVKESMELVKKRNSLNDATYKKVRKVLSGARAARYYQVQRQIQNLIDLQIQSELPLVEEAMAPAEGSGDMQ